MKYKSSKCSNTSQTSQSRWENALKIASSRQNRTYIYNFLDWILFLFFPPLPKHFCLTDWTHTWHFSWTEIVDSPNISDWQSKIRYETCSSVILCQWRERQLVDCSFVHTGHIKHTGAQNSGASPETLKRSHLRYWIQLSVSFITYCVWTIKHCRQDLQL